ncbi:gonadotropin-releasing hormone receptor [Folsomia candida]|nr:gonadotropin-releasing hormone receptor [Folsomia candida]
MSQILDTNNITGFLAELFPTYFNQMSQISRNIVIAYTFLFMGSALLNISEIVKVTRNRRHDKGRITYLYRHLCISGLIVTFTCMLANLILKLTIHWYGGNLLCKGYQFLRAFGLYLSSLVVICISIDRYFAIVYPLKFVRAEDKVKLLVRIAWVIAAICAVPQIAIFRSIPDPKFPSFCQCVATMSRSGGELIYNIFTLSILYFLPLAVIVFTYLSIVRKLYDRGRRHDEGMIALGTRWKSTTEPHVLSLDDTAPKGSPKSCKSESPRTMSNFKSDFPNVNFTLRKTKSESHLHRQKSCQGIIPPLRTNRQLLRTSEGWRLLLQRAKFRTIRLTCIILTIFLTCWTPYVVMTLW